MASNSKNYMWTHLKNIILNWPNKFHSPCLDANREWLTTNRKLGISERGRVLVNFWQTSLREQGLYIFPCFSAF